ncbi:hypothetical protein I5F70_29355, partial [Pseudomonas aeruginosa]|nr:hypothetical protein [Pseudomonas aeruginosa]
MPEPAEGGGGHPPPPGGGGRGRAGLRAVHEVSLRLRRGSTLGIVGE